MKKERLLKKEFRLLGLSQEEAGKKLGVTRATINNWVTGRIFIPPAIVLKLRELGVSNKAIASPDSME